MLNTIFVIIGTIIGAGFASGKEIFTFFNVYGGYGFVGLLLACTIIGFVIYKAFYIIINNNVTSYHEFINVAFCKSNFASLILYNIINIFLLISFIVMVAGFAAYFSQELNIASIVGALLIAVLSFITFLKSIDGVVKINVYLIPCLIIIIFILGFKNLNCFTFFEYSYSKYSFNWIIRSLLYASYNLIMLLPILISLKKYVYSFKRARIVSCGSIFFLTLMAIILFFLLNYHFTEIENIELPTVFIAGKLGVFYKYSCGFAILAAIFTTAISSGYGFLNNLNIKNSKSCIFVALAMCLFSVLLSNIGFSTLLNLLYPLLGLLRVCTNYAYII